MKATEIFARIKPKSLAIETSNGKGAHIGHTFSLSQVISRNSNTQHAKVREHNWELNKANSSIEFDAMYMKTVNIEGRFNDFDIKMKSEAIDFGDAYIELVIHTNSIDTGNTKRDMILKSEEWLDVSKAPAINFNSTELKKTGDNAYELIGNLTIHDISHTVSFNVVFNGIFTNPYPKRTFAGFTVTGVIDRRRFNLGDMTGGSNVEYEIDFCANIQIVRQ